MSQHPITENINSFNNIHSFNNVWNNCTVADEMSEILAWLSPLEPGIRHRDIQTRRIDKVGDWLLQTREYRDWLDGVREGESVSSSSSSALFCYGAPGAGKTYISSLVIDTLCRQAAVQGSAVTCFYFDFATQEEQSPAAILGSVLKQVVGGLDGVPERIVKAFQDRRKVIGGQRLVLSEIIEFLQDISSLRRTFICIDALDECPAWHRVKLLDSLNQILQKSPHARIFLTGRPHIRGEVEEHLAGRVVTRPITPTKDDFTIFLRAKLKEDTMPDAMNKSLEEEIIKNIPEIVSEIFLLAFLSIETILQETTIYRRRQKLIAMRNGLDLGGAYEATLGRIRAQGGEKARLGMAVLMWISHSRRPLQVDEMRHALVIEIGSKDLNSDDRPTISTLIGCCQGLVTVDQGSSTVRLIHFTLQDHLRTYPNLFDRAHSIMAEICLTYLNLQCIKDLSTSPSLDPRDIPFLEYSSLYWGTHMQLERSDHAKTLALELLDQWDSHTSAIFLRESIERQFFIQDTSSPRTFSALHCISYFGIAEVVGVLIEMQKWDVNQKDSLGMTPLIWATRHGHEEVVRLLLRESPLQPDQQDTTYGRTALSWAAGNGHEGIVKLLLGRKDVNPNSSGKSGQTTLSWAAENGHEGIVKLLLGRKDVNPNSSGKFGRTPLLGAITNGHERIVRQLLVRKDLNPNTPDAKSGQTPLSWAAKNGHERMVELLLGRRGVRPDTPDREYGQTPLSWAAENGHEGIVKLLLGRWDVNPNLSNNSGRTPLSWAAVNGHEGIVKLLLGCKDVNPDSSSRYGQTPLLWAAGNGHEGIVKLLLEREDVNPNSTNQSGRTPLSWAARNGHEGILKLLLGRKDVNPDTPDTEYGQTPLSWAARNGHEGIMELLLGRGDVNPDSSSNSGRTPLSWAAGNGHEGVVKLLLGWGDINPYSASKFGLTPLSWAAANGHYRVVELLNTHLSGHI